MAGKVPQASSSALLSGLLFFITLSLLEIFATKLASTPKLTILGGFVSSLLFFFGLLLVGNLKREVKWPEVILVLVVALIAAGSVHRVCVTTCFLFSVGFLAYATFISKRTYSAESVVQKRK